MMHWWDSLQKFKLFNPMENLYRNLLLEAEL